MKTLKLFVSGLLATLASASNAWAGGTGTAPACIVRTVTHKPPVYYPCQTGRCQVPGTGVDIAYVRNDCGKTMKVQVDWSWARDSACTTLSSGQDKNFQGPYYGYQRTETCT